MKRFLMLLSVCAMLLAVAPYQPAEAGVSFNFNLSCNGTDGVLSFTGATTPGTFDVYIDGAYTMDYSSGSTFQHTVSGPGTWLFEVRFYAGQYAPAALGKTTSQSDTPATEKVDRGLVTPIFSGTVSCPDGEVVEDLCFPDGRLNQNCAAPVAVYLVEDEDGVSLDIWRIMPDTSGTPEMFFTADDLEDAGNGLTVVGRSGNIVLYKLATGEYQINVWLGLKLYVLRFTMPDGAVSLETEIDLF